MISSYFYFQSTEACSTRSSPQRGPALSFQRANLALPLVLILGKQSQKARNRKRKENQREINEQQCREFDGTRREGTWGRGKKHRARGNAI